VLLACADWLAERAAEQLAGLERINAAEYQPVPPPGGQ